MSLDNKFVIYNNILSIILIILLLYSFDYSLGWGLNLIFPNIYFATFGTGNNGFDEFIWNENGVIEFFQILIILAALVVLVNGFLNRKYLNLIKFLIIFQFFGLIYIFLEEISWGQHFFKFESPNLFLDKENFLYNKQGEFNFHNTSNLFNEIPRALILLWCAFSIFSLKFINLSKNSELKFFIKPNKKLFNLSLIIIFLSVPDLIINKLNLIDNDKLFIFGDNGFEKYDPKQFLYNVISLNFIRFSELQELLIYNYFLWHSIFLSGALINKSKKY